MFGSEKSSPSWASKFFLGVASKGHLGEYWRILIGWKCSQSNPACCIPLRNWQWKPIDGPGDVWGGRSPGTTLEGHRRSWLQGLVDEPVRQERGRICNTKKQPVNFFFTLILSMHASVPRIAFLWPYFCSEVFSFFSIWMI